MTEDGARAGPAARRGEASLSPSARIVVLSATLCVASLAAVAAGVLHGAPASVPVPWWVLALLCIGAELLVFHIEINHEAHTFTFSEVPMAVGLCLATPAALVAGRLVGGLAVLGGRERQGATKVFFNLSMYLAECCLAVGIYRAVAGGAQVTNPRAWFATALGVFAADALSIGCVVLAIRWHGAEPRPGQLLIAGSVTAAANTSLGLAAALLLWTSEAAVALLAVVAAVLLLAYRSYSSLAQRHESLQLFYDFTRAIAGSVRAGSAVESILDQAREVLRSDAALIALVSGDADRPVVQVEARPGGGLFTTTRTQLLDPAWRIDEFLRPGEVLVAERGTADARLGAFLDAIGARDAMVTLLAGEASIIGVLVVADRVGEVSTYDAESARLLEILASHAGVALENGRLIEELNREVGEREYQAGHDALTDLPNRVLFFERVAERIDAQGTPFCVLLMDLDGFKEINDTLGHDSGDLVLQEVARRLRSSVPHDATVARLGGDEFAILLPGRGSVRAAEATADGLHLALDAPMHIADVTLEVRSSIGIACWPDDASDGSALLKCADVAMYTAKTTVRRVECYDAARDEHTLERLVLGAQLRNAVADDQLLVYYQPKARMSDGAIIGAEALVRWRHPDHGLMPPDEFVPVAERTGSIGALTSLVLRTALEQRAAWSRRGHDLGIAVNISVASLLDIDLPAQVARLLQVTRTPPASLTLEVTESGIMDPRRGVAALEQLAATGVRISIDDFGTGYSSLAYLARLPVHELKVDRSFVLAMAAEESSATIVRTIVDLGESLGLAVVAEGIEDRITWDALRSTGCHVGQGYFLSRPVPAAVLERWLDGLTRDLVTGSPTLR